MFEWAPSLIHGPVFLISLWVCIDDFLHHKVFHLPLFLLLTFGLAHTILYGDFLTTPPLMMGISVLLYALFSKKIGVGDLKLLWVCSFFMPVDQLPLFFICAGLFGLGTHVFYETTYQSKKAPFAPALLFGLNTCLFFFESTPLFLFVIS